MVTIRQLQIFTAVVRSGSLRACATRLGLSQVVVSNHVRELERNLGTTLFERHPGKPAVLTEQGRHAFERLSAILSDLSDLERELIGEAERRTITVTTYAFIMLKLQDRIDAFQEARPQIDVRLRLDPPDNATLAQQVIQGDVDVACYFALDDEPALGSVHAGTERLAIYVGAGHPLAGASAVPGAALCDHAAIVLSPANPQRRLCDRALAIAGAYAETILMETDALPLILHNVRRGRAWVCLFEGSTGVAEAGLVKVDLANPMPPIETRVLSRSAARHDANLMALRACFGA